MPCVYICPFRDPLSNNYLIAVFADGGMWLVDAETCTVLQDFEPHPSGATPTMCAWHAEAPGAFVTVCAETAVLREWHVSKRACVQLTRLGAGAAHRGGGCRAIKAFGHGRGGGGSLGGGGSANGSANGGGEHANTSARFLITFRDGAVGVFDLGKRRMQWSGEPGHSETVFDCKFQPTVPGANGSAGAAAAARSLRLATASYDGTCKLWNADTMTCESELVGQPGILYSCAWVPWTEAGAGHGSSSGGGGGGGSSGGAEPDQRLLTSSSTGHVWVWSTRTAQPLLRLELHAEVRVCVVIVACRTLLFSVFSGVAALSASLGCKNRHFVSRRMRVRRFQTNCFNFSFRPQ